ncbi:hypothetical protein BCR39DRAFT_587613 [Naematelia encephala]|uniref:Stress-response A/B barrel domain-containing protein n=1 Tax=Naematelia encephala TaxID=71784 RepID=A0A1Y2B8W0_9TREE|nr:hypothetical protein BCR39DRAFT_587613 [Naematelia encephala]
MTIYHVVSFSTADATSLAEITKGLRALKTTCVKPDGKPYIKSLHGGSQTSKEGRDHGMQVAFILEFENDEDLQYYLFTDEVHDQFKTKAGKEYQATGVVVLDFEDGVYPS